MATWENVANIVGELPLTEERSPREWRVGKKLIAWERPLRSSDREALTALGIEPPDGDILGVRVADEGVKFALIADEPDVYFTTPHFDGYPAVLINLAQIDELGLREVIVEAWLTQAPKRLEQEFLGEAM
ncbi:MAG TPA: MmcQ/YjbR family DNA-binding protein [Mycobacterium sp.]